MKTLEFVKPTPDLIQTIADNMRQSDVDEVLAAGDESPYDALLSSLGNSHTSVVACYEGVPLVIYGLVKPSALGGSVIWMLGTTQSCKFKREFMYYTRQVIAEMMKECTMLYNYVHSKNVTSIRWLRALGFTIGDSEPSGVNGEYFHKFYMMRTNHV